MLQPSIPWMPEIEKRSQKPPGSPETIFNIVTWEQQIPKSGTVKSMDDQDLLRSAYKSFNARDLDSVLRTLHQEVDWPNGMEGGRVHGHAGVRDYWTRQWNLVDPHVEPVSFAAREDGRVAVTVHQTVRDMSGKVLMDQFVEHIYRIEDGLIVHMEILGTV
jgi:ketosteroid isomerase-like protein